MKVIFLEPRDLEPREYFENNLIVLINGFLLLKPKMLHWLL